MDAQEKSERLMEAASAVLEAAPDRTLNTVVLNKALFYLDLAYLRDHGRTLTGNAYIALQQGPVVAKYPERLIAALESRGIASQLKAWDGSKPVRLQQAVAYRFLDAPALSLAAAVAEFFAKKSSSQASDYSHENAGWALAWAEFARVRRPCSIDMLIAMQQIIQDDPWMDQPLLEDDEALASADAGDGIDW